MTRIIIEICAESDSAIGRVYNMCDHCIVVRITKDDDFASEAGVCILGLRSPRDMLSFSAPGTGGSTWQYININAVPKLLQRMMLLKTSNLKRGEKPVPYCAARINGFTCI